jgi:glycosyltransferase involved in cell wall biosynthesis
MNIAVGICTRNNPTLLRRTLQSITAQKLKASVRVVCYIVDTSSTRRSQRVINAFRDLRLRQFIFRSTHRPRLPRGIIYARMQLFSLVREPYLFLLDDDIVADPHWIANGLAAFAKSSDIGVVGGKTVPYNSAPVRFHADLAALNFSRNFWPYALIDLGDTGKYLTRLHHYPCFSNAAIRTSILKRIAVDDRFATGRLPLPMFGGEDPDFMEQAYRISRIYYEPRMRVSHIIKPYKFTRRYFLWRYIEWGKERALLEAKYGLPQSASPQQILLSVITLIKELTKRKPLFAPLLSLLFSLSYLYAQCIILFIGNPISKYTKNLYNMSHA